MRWIAAILLGILGAAIGAFSGNTLGETELAPYSHGVVGALIGGCLGALFAFAFFVVLAMVLAAAAVVGFQLLTGTA